VRPDSGWQRRFDDPIPLPGGGQLVTLKDAAEYILALPAKTSEQEHWQLAMQMLIDAADRGGIVMLAHIAVVRALNHGQPDPGDAAAATQAGQGLSSDQMNPDRAASSGSHNRRVSNGDQVSRVAALAMKRGKSMDFTGYWQPARSAAEVHGN
jgi:hypothetical protein